MAYFNHGYLNNIMHYLQLEYVIMLIMNKLR